MKGMRIRTRTAVVLALVTLCIPGIFGCMGIRGGTELVIRVQVEEAVNAKTDQALRRLRDRMTANSIPYDGISKKASLEFEVQGVPQDSESTGNLHRLVEDEFSEWDLERLTAEGGLTTWRVSMRDAAALAIRQQTLEQAMDSIRRRVEAFSFMPKIQEHGQGEYQILVQLPGVDVPDDSFARLREIVQAGALLELKLVADGPFSSRDDALAPGGGVLPPGTHLLRGASGATRSTAPEWYIVNRIAVITSSDIIEAEASRDINGHPSVGFTLSRDGAARLGRITGENIGRLLAIVLDGQIQSVPRIEGQIFNRGEITGRFTAEETADLALVLRSSPSPAPIIFLEERTVKPSLFGYSW